VDQVSNFKYLGNAIFGEEKDIIVILRRYNKMNGIIKRNFLNCKTHTKLTLHNITSKTALFCGSETWITNKTDSPKTEATQMRVLRSLFGLNTGSPKKQAENRKHSTRSERT
jgi:hypothetical protein